MEDLLLILILGILFVAGYFVMNGLDKFLEKNNRIIKKEKPVVNENEPASCVMLTEKLSDEEIAHELREFRKNHKNTKIMIYEETESFFCENKEQ